MGTRKTKIINVDFQRLERFSYKSHSPLGKEILNKMILLSEKRKSKLTLRQQAKQDIVHAAIDEVLTARQKEVIDLVFGLSGLEPMTEESIGETLGISRGSVKTLKKRSIDKLKAHMELNQTALKNIKNN